MPVAPAIIPLELMVAFAGPVMSTVMTRLVSATDGAAAKRPANALGFSTSLKAEKATTRVPPARAFKATAISCIIASQKGAGAPPPGATCATYLLTARRLPAVPAPATRSSENKTEDPEHEPDQQQDPQNVQRRRHEPASPEQEQQQ